MHASKSSIHPETPIIVLKSIFQRYDADHDGLLNSNEFGNALEDLGINDATEQQALFALADSNNSKTVHLNDFIKLIKSNDFELILSSREDYEFVIETYKVFQQYDENADGQITWDEFYFYLTKHGYSHQYISQYWYYLDVDQKLTVSFEGFWRGFKFQANAIKQRELQQQINKEIVDKHNSTKHKKKNTIHSKVLNSASIIDNYSWSHNDKKNILNYMKSQLKPTKVHKSSHAVAVGRVLDNDTTDVNCTKSLRIKCTNLNAFQPQRLPDIIAMPQSPLHAILPSFKANHARDHEHVTSNIILLSPTFPDILSSSDISPSVTPNYSVSSTPNYSWISTPNYSLILTPNYSNDLTASALSNFASNSLCSAYVSPFSTSANIENAYQFPSIASKESEHADDEKHIEDRKKRKRRKKKRMKRKKLKLMKAASEQINTIDNSSVLRPKKISKYLKKHKIYQSVSIDI